MHPLLAPLEYHATHRPHHPAAWDQNLMLDYAQFHAVSQGLAKQVVEQTDRPHVGILAPTSTAGAAAIFACWYAGRIPVPLNFMLAPTELTRVIADAELDLVLAVDLFSEQARAAGLRVLPLDARTLVPGRLTPPRADERDTAVLLYTSGTSGEPKGVMLSCGNIIRNAAACVEAIDLQPDEVFLGLLPQFHAFGLTTTTFVPLYLGATVHYLPRFSGVTVLNLIAERHVTVFITIASMFGALAAMKNVAPETLASLRLPVSGGEPLPQPVAEVWEQHYGRRIYEGYGMTEASPVISLNTPAAYRPRSVGRPLPGVSVTAVDLEGQPVPAGSDGELVIRGHGILQGYRGKPEQTAAVLRDGALYSGDIGRVDADGFIYITGRKKEMLIVGGENVFPPEIESVLLRHPAVQEAAVIGVPDGLRGEAPVAFVILRSEAPEAPAARDGRCDEAALRAFCKEHLASYKVPRQVRIVADLPRGPTGKILKRALSNTFPA